MHLKTRAKMSILKICSFENNSAAKHVLIFIFHVSEHQNAKTKPPSPKLTATSIVSSKNRDHLFPLFIKPILSLTLERTTMQSHVHRNNEKWWPRWVWNQVIFRKAASSIFCEEHTNIRDGEKESIRMQTTVNAIKCTYKKKNRGEAERREKDLRTCETQSHWRPAGKRQVWEKTGGRNEGKIKGKSRNKE